VQVQAICRLAWLVSVRQNHSQTKILNIDETSHKELKKRLWTWVFRAEKFAASSAIQGRSDFDFIKDSIMAHFCRKDKKYPSLLDKD
jgi:rubredoxin